MEALFASLVSKYGFEMAAKILGLDQQTDNPKYTFGMPFTGKQVSFSPLQTLGRFGLNKVMSGGIGGMAIPAAFLGGAVMLGRAFDPRRPGSRNYNPNLAGQIDYLNFNNMIGRDPNSGGLKYGPESVLAGQNVVSMFGTNDYRDQLEKKKNYFENRISKGKNYSQTQYEKTLKEIRDFEQDEINKELDKEKKARDRVTSFKSYSGPTGRDIHGGGGGGGFNQASYDAGKASAAAQEQSNRDYARGRFNKGGIASL